MRYVRFLLLGLLAMGATFVPARLLAAGLGRQPDGEPAGYPALQAVLQYELRVSPRRYLDIEDGRVRPSILQLS